MYQELTIAPLRKVLIIQLKSDCLNIIPKLQICIIENCGELRENEPWNIGENDGTMDIYPPWPDDWDDRGTNIQLEDVIIKIKDSGNFYFKKHNYNDSDRKYRKALRYIDYLYTKGCNFDRKLVEEMKINSLLNLAAVRLKKKKYQDANLYCEQVIFCLNFKHLNVTFLILGLKT